MKLIIALAILLATPAYAANNCGPRDVLRAALTDKHGEAPAFRGMAPKGVVSIWINQETGSWSATIDNANGVSCLVASGSFGTLIPLPPTGDPA